MEQFDFGEKYVRKIYSEKKVFTATALGGPLVAGYMMAENFRSFGKPKMAVNTWLWAVAATVAILSILFSVPEGVLDRIPNYIISAITAAITMVFMQVYQREDIARHTEHGGQMFGWWRTVGVGFAGAAVTAGVILAASYMTYGVNEAQISSKTYGVMAHEISFDMENISADEVDMIADGLTETMFFDDTQRKTVFAEKLDGAYEMSISVVEGTGSNSLAIEIFTTLRNEMQELFPDNKIVINLVVDDLTDVVKRIE